MIEEPIRTESPQAQSAVQELHDKLFDAYCEIEELKQELAQFKKPIPKKLSEIATESKKAPQYLDELPETVLQIDEYCGKQFDRYYYDYDEERILMRTTTGKIKVVNDSVKNSKYITMSDVNGNPKSCLYSKLIKFLKNALET